MEDAKALALSSALFLWGILKRFYFIVPGLFAGGVDLVEREADKGISVSPPVFWAIIAAGVFVAALLTYHDLRRSKAASAGMPSLITTTAGPGTKTVTRAHPSGEVEIESEAVVEEDEEAA